jgi:Protein of unknown function (DUF1579)
MGRSKIAVSCLAVLISTLALAQQGPPPMPKPAPEHQRLHYFVGTWHNEGEMKPGPMGPGGKFTSTDHNQMVGPFFLVLRSDGTGPMGPMKDVAVMGYDAKEKVYTYDGFNSMGLHEISKGSINGKTWTWTSIEDMGGKKVQTRFILTEVPPTSYTYKFDVSEDGQKWDNVMEGKATKAAAKAAQPK